MRANEVNATMLWRLKDEEYRIFARAKGKINESSYPTDDELVIKKWAQIMFLVNNVEKWFMNGTIWIIVDILQYDDDFEGKPKEFEVKVLIPGRSDPIIVWPHVWEIRESRYDEKEKAIKSETVWTFEQIPIRLAWACTIHKAQWKTFDSMIIDSGSGMFAPWQAYVALSRCTSLSGIKLVRPIMMRDIMLDNVVSNYVTQLSSMSIVVPEQTLPVVKKWILERITKKYTDATAPMSVLVFDTETTWVNRTARIVQIACALYEKDENNNRSCTTVYDYLINPLCPIPAETTAVHGINDDMVKDAPTLDMIRENVHQLFDRAHIHVAHNIAFDERILAQEVRRLKLAKITKRPIFCTMMEWVEVVRIPSDRGWYKWPKLAELYTHLWQENVDWYHDALVDVKAAAACYFKMKGETYNPFH